ncbi:unnamed protein product [Adineta steineri]|uniref:Uncharacterized protein n=1 Tax=Adineta steineri TaxID=433720 RepID=A0A815ZA25_9BILA|nr:unnamed protein product [Adineta steineri]CAF1580852.1 unnamed protein product [Adineta steineri]
MATLSNAQVLSTTKPTCPRCHRNDRAYNDGAIGSAAAAAAKFSYHRFNHGALRDPEIRNSDRYLAASCGGSNGGSRVVLNATDFLDAYLDAASATYYGCRQDHHAGDGSLGYIGKKTRYCYFKIPIDSAIYVCDYKH